MLFRSQDAQGTRMATAVSCREGQGPQATPVRWVGGLRSGRGRGWRALLHKAGESPCVRVRGHTCPVRWAPAGAQVPEADPGRGPSSWLLPPGAGDTGTRAPVRMWVPRGPPRGDLSRSRAGIAAHGRVLLGHLLPGRPSGSVRGELGTQSAECGTGHGHNPVNGAGNSKARLRAGRGGHVCRESRKGFSKAKAGAAGIEVDRSPSAA